MILPDNYQSLMLNARERYNLSGKHMSSVTGFGVNQWRLYESGKATPNGPNARLIAMVLDPYSFVKLLEIVPVRALGIKVYTRTMLNALGACKEIDTKLIACKGEFVRDIFKSRS